MDVDDASNRIWCHAVICAVAVANKYLILFPVHTLLVACRVSYLGAIQWGYFKVFAAKTTFIFRPA